jgi:hypothetical protein
MGSKIGGFPHEMLCGIKPTACLELFLRNPLDPEDIAHVYTLRWDIGIFFGWWKQHLNVYHLIARGPHGFMAQILGGLITCRLFAIYCHDQHKEKVSINRVRELRINIRNEIAQMMANHEEHVEAERHSPKGPLSHASP